MLPTRTSWASSTPQSAVLTEAAGRVQRHRHISLRRGGPLSEAGSLQSEMLDTAGRYAAEMMQLPLTCAGVGVVCLCAPRPIFS